MILVLVSKFDTHVCVQSISSFQDITTIFTRIPSIRSQVFTLNVVSHVRALGLKSTFLTLPTSTTKIRHHRLQQFWGGNELVKLFIYSKIFNFPISLWYLWRWLLRAFLFLRSLSQYWQGYKVDKSEVDTCLASMWYFRLVLFFDW